MPNINDPANTLSVFPTGIDNLPPVTDGSGVNSNNTATRLNTIETAIYRLQNHTQQIVQVVSNPEDRRRLILLGTLVNAAPAASISLTFSLTAAQLTFLGNQPWLQGNVILADCYNKQGSVGVFTITQLADPGSITVIAKTLDYQNGTSVPAGTYLFRLTILGRS